MMGVGISSYIVFSNFKRTLVTSHDRRMKANNSVALPYLKTQVPAMPQLSLGRVEKPTMDRILLIGLLFSAVSACLGKPADPADPVAGIWVLGHCTLHVVEFHTLMNKN